MSKSVIFFCLLTIIIQHCDFEHETVRQNTIQCIMRYAARLVLWWNVMIAVLVVDNDNSAPLTSECLQLLRLWWRSWWWFESEHYLTRPVRGPQLLIEACGLGFCFWQRKWSMIGFTEPKSAHSLPSLALWYCKSFQRLQSKNKCRRYPSDSFPESFPQNDNRSLRRRF